MSFEVTDEEIQEMIGQAAELAPPQDSSIVWAYLELLHINDTLGTSPNGFPNMGYFDFGKNVTRNGQFAQNEVYLRSLSYLGYPAVRLTLPNDDYIIVSVYDICGNVVKILYRGELRSGEHMLKWNGYDDNGEKLPSGMYFINAFTSQKTSQVKVLLIQ